MNEIDELMTTIRHFFEKNTLLVERNHISLLNALLESKLHKSDLPHIAIYLPEINEYVDARIYQLVKQLNKIGIETHASCEHESYPNHPFQIVVKQKNREKFVEFISKCYIDPIVVDLELIHCIYVSEEDHDKLLYCALKKSLKDIKNEIY